MAQFALEVQVVLEILNYPSPLSCLEIRRIQDHLWPLADRGHLVLPGDLVAPCLLRLQVDLFGQALPSTPCLLLCLLQDSLEVPEDQACLGFL